MTFSDYSKFANENPICQLATVDGDQPRLRTLVMVAADDDGFWFCTLSPKAVSTQLHKNPRVEVCFFNQAKDPMEWKMMRVTGKIEFLKNEVMFQKAMEQRAGLSQIVGKPVEPYVEIFRIHSGDAHFWMLKDILKEPQLEHVRF